MTVDIRCGDCLDVLPTLEPDSFHACVTDPPYHLTSTVDRFGRASAVPPRNDDLYKRMARGFMGQTWAGVAMAVGAGLVGFVASAMDENGYPFDNGDRGTLGGLLGGLAGLLAVGFGGVMFYYGLPAVLLCVGALWSITMAGSPLYLWLKERPDRKRLAAEQQQREVEAMERELGLR